MSRPKSAHAPAAPCIRGIFLAGALALGACEGRNLGVSPTGAGLYFPAAMTLDPRVSADEPSRWLFVANANSNLVYNAGSLVAVDLDRFFRSWMNCADLCLYGIDDGTCSGRDRDDPCGVNAKVRDVAEDVDEDAPCRHVALRPQVIECEDRFMLSSTMVRTGSFITSLEGWVKDPAKDTAYLLAAVKADPSITWVELRGGRDGVPLEFDCGQGPDSGLRDEERCSRATHALRFPFDDSEGFSRIGPEPAKILVSKTKPWAYVTFATTPEVVLIDLQGKTSAELEPNSGLVEATTGATSTGGGSTTGGSSTGGEERPSYAGTQPLIVDRRAMFLAGQQTSGGGWGLAERPCFKGTDEVPAVTRASAMAGGELEDCARPLLYGGARTTLLLARMFPDAVEPLQRSYAGLIAALEQQMDAAATEAEREALGLEIERLGALTQRCLGDDNFGEEGVILCSPQLFFNGFAPVGGFDNGTGLQGSAILGDIAFSRDGRRLFAVQTSPGALVYVDTSVDERGIVRDEPAGVVELCVGPTAMQLFEDGANEYAAVSCPSASEVFIIDLSGFRVVANVATGLGPHPIVVDRARRLLYVGNTLDKTVGVIDIARDRPTRFAEIARVGLQEPYKR